jgi:hypothetical protein
MGKRFLHSIVQPNTDLAASASITPFDLPVNPLSALLLRLEVDNTDPSTDLIYSAIDDAITQISSIRILHKGELIIQGSLRDLMVFNMLACGAYPGWARLTSLDTGIRSLLFPLCFGRRMYDPASCFPATTRGNLRFEMDAIADGAGHTDINFSVSAIELIEAQPTEYLKYTTNARTAVVGQFDALLPIGNELLGVLLFDTGLQTLEPATYSWGDVKLLKDNVEQYYPNERIEVLAAMMYANRWGHPFWPGHFHEKVAAVGAASRTTEAEQEEVTGSQGYAYLDFDPLRDGSYSLETKGASDLKIRAVGASATAVRWLPAERVMLG